MDLSRINVEAYVRLLEIQSRYILNMSINRHDTETESLLEERLLWVSSLIRQLETDYKIGGLNDK